MERLSNNVLSTIETLTRYLGPVTTLFDSIVERIAPNTRAHASCGGYYCYSTCSVDTCFLWWRVSIDYYVDNPAYCVPDQGLDCEVINACGSC